MAQHVSCVFDSDDSLQPEGAPVQDSQLLDPCRPSQRSRFGSGSRAVCVGADCVDKLGGQDAFQK